MAKKFENKECRNNKIISKDKINSRRYSKILSSILKENLPDNKVVETLNSVVNIISNNLRKARIKADVVVGGSVAKNVFLKNDYDCDLFVRFDYEEFKNKDSKLSDVLESVLKDFDFKRIHGSRDYFQFNFNGVNFEVIPVLKISSVKQAKNVMDYSPLHVDWFNKNANDNIRNCVRLLKLFCKAQGIYGAESFINGFSGHVIDVLSVYYGSFINVLKAASYDWNEKISKNEKIVIDIKNYHKGKALFVLNKSKIQNSLIVIDPIDPYRNAAASLSDKNLRTFIKSAQEFLKKPSPDFFIIKEFNEKEILNIALKNKKYLLLIKALPLNKSVDVAGCKLLKAYNFILSELLKNDFEVEDKGFYWSKNIEEPGVFYFFIKSPVLSDEKIIKGPSLKFEEAVKNFKIAHKKTIEKQGFVFAIEKRKIRKINDFIRSIMNSDYLKDKVLRINYFEFCNK
ncbi:MAG: nucleotidyltransferase domain-containing protein [Candidatus Woesearchaeota archaeon]